MWGGFGGNGYVLHDLYECAGETVCGSGVKVGKNKLLDVGIGLQVGAEYY